MAKWQEIRELTRVRILLFLREPEAVFWVFIFPLVLAAVLGFAFRSSGPEPSQVALLEMPGAEAMADQLTRVEGLEVERFSSREEAEEALRKGVVQALLAPGEPPLLRLDPTRPESELARLRVLQGLNPAAPPALTREDVEESGSRYVDFLFPGLLGLNLMGTGMWMIGFAVADLRQRKVLKRMLVTPMRRSSFLGSFIFARLAFLIAETAALTAFGVWVLGVPFRAQLLHFVLMCLLGSLAFAGLGLLATARVRTIQGASGVLNLFMMPMWLLSGVFFSYERFPEALHPLLRLLPLTALNDALRGQMLDGARLYSQVPEMLTQLAWGVIAFLLALKLFRWE